MISKKYSADLCYNKNKKEYESMEESYSSSYNKLLTQLQIEVSQRQKNNYQKGYKFTENQQKIFDLIVGKKEIAQFNIDNRQFFLKTGIKEKGLVHILLRHYVHHNDKGTKDGEVYALDILNIANVIEKGIPMSEYEITDNETMEKIGYKQQKGDRTYFVILNKERNGNWFITFYSDYRLMSETGDCS